MLTRGILIVLALTVAQGAADTRANDAWLTLKVRLALMATDDIDSTKVHVDTQRGVITLFGRVPSEQAKTAASKNVGDLDGIERVDNLLEVVPPQKEKAVAAADDVIRRSADAAIENAPALTESDIRVLSVDKSVVMLGGKAVDLPTHVYAVELVHQIPGVRRVESRVLVTGTAPSKRNVAPRPLKDTLITTAVKMRLIANERVPSLGINVDTCESTVTLFGKVDSAEAKDEAAREARAVTGVNKVENELVVDPTIQRLDAKDKDIEAEVKRLLSKEDLKHLRVAVRGGVVRLSGRVPTESERVRAAMVSRTARGARAVKTDLDVGEEK